MIIFYHGTDIYRLRLAITALRERDQGAQPRALTIQADNQQDLVELERSLKYPSFFQEQIYIILRNILVNADTADAVHQLLVQYDVANIPEVTVIACHEGPAGRESSSTKKLSAYLQKHARQVTQFLPLQGTQLTQWINEFCSQRARTIEESAASLVIDRAGQDSWALANELEKLCAYATSTITPGMVDLLVPAPQERDDFQLSNAITAGDKRGGIGTLWDRLHRGVAGQLLLGTLAYAVRSILSIGDLAVRRMPAGAIASTAGMPPFVVSKTLRTIANHDMKKIQQAHAALAALDRDAKEGRADIEDGLFSVIMDL